MAEAQAFDPPCPAGLCLVVPFPQQTPTLSPPIVEPILACTSLVAVSGYVPGNRIEIYLGPGASPTLLGSFAGGASGDGVFDVAGRLAALGLEAAFTVGQRVRARQRSGFASSAFSDEVRVTTGGPPSAPQIEQPLYQCGRTLRIAGVERGMTVSVMNEPTTGGSSLAVPPFVASSTEPFVGVDPNLATSRFRARSQLCGVSSPPGALETIIPTADGPPEPLAPPVIVNQSIIAGQLRLEVDGAVLGGVVHVRVDGVVVRRNIVSARPGERHQVAIPAARAGSRISVGQTLCGTGTPTFGPDTVVGTCTSLPPPQVRLPRIGDRFVDVQVAWPGATITAFVGTVEVADGSGPRLALTRPLAAGEVLTVFQTVGTCTSRLAFRATTQCTQQDYEFDRSETGPFGAGRAEYTLPDTVELGGRQVTVRGFVHFPVDRAGPAQRLARWGGPYPIVFVMHLHTANLVRSAGAPRELERFLFEPSRLRRQEAVASGNYVAVDAARGYPDLLDALARAGIIAVSIDAEDLASLRVELLEAGADLFVQHIRYWRDIEQGVGGASLLGATVQDFEDRIDLTRVGLAGHSRGGGRVPLVASRPGLPEDVQIRSGLLIAPVVGAVAGLDIPWLVLGGSRDVDVIDQPVVDYDAMAASRERFLEWVYGATHSDWNARATETGAPEFGDEDGLPNPPVPPDAAEQVRMLRAWGRLWFEWTLIGRNETVSRNVLNGDSRLRGLRPEIVLASHARADDRAVDSFQRTSPAFAAFDLPGTAFSDGFADFRQEFWFPYFSPIDGRITGNLNGTVSVYAGGAAGTWDGASAGVTYSFASPQDATAFSNVSFRVAKLQCPRESHDSDSCRLAPERTGLGVTVTATSRGVSRSAAVSASSGDAVLPGRFIPAPWAYGRNEYFRTYSRSVPRTIRVPRACFGSVPADFWSRLDGLQISVSEDDPAPGGVVFTDVAFAH